MNNMAKKNKRGQNEGSLREKFRKDAKTGELVSIGWEARYTDPTGKQKSIFAKTRAEVNKKLTKALNDINQGTYVEPSNTAVTEWMDTWYKDYKKPAVKVKTLEGYESIIRNHIKPALGAIKLKDLKSETIQKLYNDIANRLSPRMAQLTHVTLHSALQQAYVNNLIPRNPAMKGAVIIPKSAAKEARVLTSEEQAKFMKALKGERLEAAFLLDLATGLRVGELAALAWDNIDLDKKLLKVNRTLYRVKNPDKGAETKTKLVFDTPKSAKSNRTIPLLDEIISVLKAHKKRQAAERLKAGGLVEDGGVYQDNNLVFCTEIGTPLDPRKIQAAFYTIVDKAGIGKANMHCLRHCFATRMLENGVDLKTTSELLGHSKISLTGDIYSHVMMDKKQDAIGKIKGIFAATAD
jgi:integrase